MFASCATRQRQLESSCSHVSRLGQWTVNHKRPGHTPAPRFALRRQASLPLEPTAHRFAADLDSDDRQPMGQRFGGLAGLRQSQQFVPVRFQLRSGVVARVARLGDSLGQRGGRSGRKRGVDG